MPRKTKLLNVREIVAFGQRLAEDLVREHDEGEWLQRPIYRDAINEFRFLAKCLLAKHDKVKAKGNRKDIYLEAK